MRAKNNRSRLIGSVLLAMLVATIAGGFSFILNDGTDLPIKWPPNVIRMRVMVDNNTRLSDGLTRAGTIQEAMFGAQRGWNRYLGNIQFSPQVMSPGEGGDGNGQNEIFFAATPYDREWDSNTLAITTVWAQGNERGEADLIFNSGLSWDSYRGNRQGSVFDIQRVALHELGHVLGLDHPDEDGQTVSAIMNSHISNLDSLTTDDINGAQSLYGPPGVPANDNFANAITISLSNGTSATVNGFNTNATKEAGEPALPDSRGGHSVWWRWTAPSDGNVSIDTRGSYFDSTLAVYTGSALNALTQVAYNDDIRAGIVQASFVSFPVTSGTTYRISVDGWASQTNLSEEADSAAVILSVVFASSGAAAPTIVTQPTGITVSAGSSASLSVVASGAAPLSYQWYFGVSPVSGATSATYTIASAQAANAGSYYVVVSNPAGSVTSNTVSLAVTAGGVSMPTGGGGGGGGGAPSVWFCVALSALGICRRLFRRQT